MFWRRSSQFQRRVQFSFVTRETLKTQFGSKKSSIEVTKSHTFQIKKIDLISLFTYFQLQSLKALLAKTIILLKLRTFFEISKPYCFTLLGERSTKSTASTTSSMKRKNRKQIEIKVTLPPGPLIVLRHAIAPKEMQCVTTNF